MSKDELSYKRFALRAVRELKYPKEIIEKLNNATSEKEIEHIMVCARKEMFA